MNGKSEIELEMEMVHFISENNLSYRRFESYCVKNNKDEWLGLLLSNRKTKRFIQSFARDVAYKYAKIRNEEFYQWCKDNGYSVFEGLDKIPKDRDDWEEILMSPKSVEYLLRRERSEESKKVKEGIPNTRKRKPVRCINDGMEFSSINKAAEYYGIRRTHDISDCCYGVIGNVRGLSFEFINEDE